MSPVLENWKKVSTCLEVLSFLCLLYERTGKKLQLDLCSPFTVASMKELGKKLRLVWKCLLRIPSFALPSVLRDSIWRRSGLLLLLLFLLHRHYSTRDFLVFNVQNFMYAISTDPQYSVSFMYAIYSDKK